MKIPRLAWSPEYSVGVETLDAQHRGLFDIVNRLVDVFESDDDDVLPIIKELVDYLSVHFNAERVVMKDADYPGLSGHVLQHEKFTKKTEEFLKRYKEEDRELTFDMVVFLRDWLFKHTCGIDLEYGKYLRRQKVSGPSQ